MERRVAEEVQPSAAGDAFMRALRVDHARLSRVLRELDVQQAHLKGLPGEARPVLVEAMRYLLHYQHAFHHPREDRLFERISHRAPRLGREMRTLVREHRGGLRQAEKLAADLTGATLPQLRGTAGARLAGRIRQYVAHTRDHMRSEEVVFYAQSERVLDESDWTALLAEAVPDDPMGNQQRLAREYPRLAVRLFQHVSEVAGHGDTYAADQAGAVERARVAARDGIEQLFELYGELMHDALEVAQTNFAGLRMVRSPWDLAQAGESIGARSYKLVVRCVADPPRLAFATFAQVLAAFRPGTTARQR